MLRILLLLLLPFSVLAQNPPVRERLDTVACYKEALRHFIKSHPETIIQNSKGKTVLVKKNSFLGDYVDSLTDVAFCFLDPDSEASVLGSYKVKKSRLYMLDLQQMMMRNLNAFIWVMPFQVKYDTRKKAVEESAYTGTTCEYEFDYTPDRQRYFLWKTATCHQSD